MVLNTEKRRMLVEAASKLKVGAGPSDANVDLPVAIVSAPNPFSPAPADLRLKGVVEAAAFEDEDTCSGLIFKRKMGANAAVPTQSASDDRTSSFRENPPPPMLLLLVTWWYTKAGGECP